MQGDAHLAADAVLAGVQEGLEVPGEGIEEVTLVQKAAVEVAQGLLPEQLLAGQDQLLQLPVGADEQVRGGGLVAHAALDAEDGVAEVHASADAVGAAQVIEAGDEGDGVQAFAVQRHRDALIEADDQGGGGGGPDGAAGEGRLGQGAPGVQGLPAAHAGAPHALVDGVVLGLLGEHQAALGAVVHLLGPGQAQVADGGQELQVRGQGAEGHIEAHLVVAGAGGAVGDGRGAHALGQLCNRAGLADALGGDRQGVHLAAQHVAVDQVAQVAVEEAGPGVHGGVADGAEFGRGRLDARQLLRREPTRIHRDRSHLIALLLQVEHTEGRIKTARKGEDCELAHGRSFAEKLGHQDTKTPRKTKLSSFAVLGVLVPWWRSVISWPTKPPRPGYGHRLWPGSRCGRRRARW